MAVRHGLARQARRRRGLQKDVVLGPDSLRAIVLALGSEAPAPRRCARGLVEIRRCKDTRIGLGAGNPCSAVLCNGTLLVAERARVRLFLLDGTVPATVGLVVKRDCSAQPGADAEVSDSSNDLRAIRGVSTEMDASSFVSLTLDDIVTQGRTTSGLSGPYGTSAVTVAIGAVITNAHTRR